MLLSFKEVEKTTFESFRNVPACKKLTVGIASGLSAELDDRKQQNVEEFDSTIANENYADFSGS